MVLSTMIVLAIAGVACAQAPEVEMVFLPAADVQASGPAHDFRIGRIEIRNDQFADFLNDALANLDNERGVHLHFDTDSGDVFIAATEAGVTDTDGAGTIIFDSTANPALVYDDLLGEYVVGPGLGAHPVTGVSWYGAVKYCNWLTISSGLSLDERAYAESTSDDLAGWRPVTITSASWAVRDLTAAERSSLLALRGFRLPMDGGDAAANPSIYNEWFKAAAARPDTVGVAFDSLYGFGRDVIGPADANFRCSGDPFEDAADCLEAGTTPTGFFDGANTLADLTVTAVTTNAYGLYDLSGNVWEWMQDQSFDPADRRNRGGSFRNSAAFLQVSIGAERSADAANDSTGFRVAQSVPTPLVVTPDEPLMVDGLWGGPLTPDPPQQTFQLANLTDSAIDVAVTVDQGWVSISGVPPGIVSLAGGALLPVVIEVVPACDASAQPGINTATVTILDVTNAESTTRDVQWTMTEPISVSPVDDVSVQVVFGDTPVGAVYTLTSASDSVVQWSARAEDTSDPLAAVAWILLDGAPTPTQGTIDPMVLNTADVTVAFDLTGLEPGVHQAQNIFENDCTGSMFVRDVTVTIDAPFSVAPDGDSLISGVQGGPFDPPSIVFTLSNLLDATLDWDVTMEPVAPETLTDWLGVDASGGSLVMLDDSVDVTATILPFADSKLPGDYTIRLRFTQAVTGYSVERLVTLNVTDLDLQPTLLGEFAGPRGGAIVPSAITYTLNNNGTPKMEWTAEVVDDCDAVLPAALPWATVEPSLGLILEGDGIATLTVSPSSSAAFQLVGTHVGQLCVTNALSGVRAVRDLELVIRDEAFVLSMTQVPPAEVQPAGPDHRFRISRFEITNAQYVQFLNDAEVDGGATGRGSFMDFDAVTGAVGVGASQDTLLCLTQNVAPASRIIYDPLVSAGGRYRVEAGFEQHPVTHVSWYGAIKYCNWLTLAQGMAPSQRAYVEGLLASDWMVVPIMGQPAAPADLIGLRGFRLPLDEAATSASLFNEWYKAAAWRDDLQSNAVYGFGRDTIAFDDANVDAGGDPFEPGTTPVGFFDGTLYNSGGGGAIGDGVEFETNPLGDENGYALFDMTGNVAEWMHDLGDSPTQRAIRGGQFASDITSPNLTNAARSSLPADSAVDFVGFRVVQALPDVVDDIDITQDFVSVGGPVGGPYQVSSAAVGVNTFTLTVTNVSDYTADSVSFAIAPVSDQLQFIAEAPGLLAAQSSIGLMLEVAATTSAPGVSPPPTGDFAFVPGSDLQPGGPDYDFWIGRTEVTNAEFAQFLNAALVDVQSLAPTTASNHLYFDLDLGSVYINDAVAGTTGTGVVPATVSTLIYDVTLGRIDLIAGAYVVESGFSDHPVVGVSWYGAVKYCNWLSAFENIPAALWAYTEAPSPNLAGWHPAVIDDATWTSVGMPAVARRVLVQETLGYRLPMDDEAMAASPYNEWYKAAAWDPIDATVSTYGFGRDALLNVDANFLDSDDTNVNETTAVGFFDGIQTLFVLPATCTVPQGAAVATSVSTNAYGLLDACGNVAEWTQDFGADNTTRALRGGGFLDAIASSLLTTMGRRFVAPESVASDVGFRVVRGTGYPVTVSVTDHLAGTTQEGHFILDLTEPLRVEPRTDLAHTGPYRGVVAISVDYSLINASAADMAWTVSSDQPWVDAGETVSGDQAGTILGVPAGLPVTIGVGINGSANDLPPGTHTAIVTFTNETTGSTRQREVSLVIDPAVTVASLAVEPHEFTGPWGGAFITPLAVRAFDVTNVSGFDLDYDVSANTGWLDVAPVDPLDQLTGMLASGASKTFDVDISAAANAFNVGSFDGSIAFGLSDPQSSAAWSQAQSVRLVVNEPIVITQSAQPWLVGPNILPGSLPSNAYTITNTATAAVIELQISVDQNWLDVDLAMLEVLPGGADERIVTVSLNDNALMLFDGIYPASITFTDMATGVAQCRDVVLNVEESISVAPFDDFVTAGVVGESPDPSFAVYRVTNVARDAGGPINWQVTAAGPVPWITINGGTAASGVLADGATALVVIAIDPAQTQLLLPGQHQASVVFQDLTNAESMTRAVDLTLVQPTFAMSLSEVRTDTLQPGGPGYAFEIGAAPVTNAQFAAFLNDAIASGGNERGAYMFFDTVTGDVYVNNAEVGASGVDPGSRSILMFSPSVAAQIEYLGGSYQAQTVPIDFTDHPVSAVTWYGAVKFSNWMTIDQGALPGARCYGEGIDTDLPAWRPVTVSRDDWIVRDLSDVERESLVTGYRGFRLPMDDGAGNPLAGDDSADAYNEWYRAAAWDGTRNTAYGFGADTLTGADANFLDSGDAFDNGTTPAGQFTPNASGLVDVTGNVYHWMQDRFNGNVGSLSFRAFRGGSWSDSVVSPNLLAVSRNVTLATLTSDQIGFRVLRVLPAQTADFDNDGDVDANDLLLLTICLGSADLVPADACAAFDLQNDGAVDLRDVAILQNGFGNPP